MVAPINPKAALYFGGRRGGRLTEVEMSLTSLVDRAPTFMAPREPAYSTTHEYSTVLYCTTLPQVVLVGRSLRHREPTRYLKMLP